MLHVSRSQTATTDDNNALFYCHFYVSGRWEKVLRVSVATTRNKRLYEDVQVRRHPLLLLLKMETRWLWAAAAAGRTMMTTTDVTATANVFTLICMKTHLAVLAG